VIITLPQVKEEFKDKDSKPVSERKAKSAPVHRNKSLSGSNKNKTSSDTNSYLLYGGIGFRVLAFLSVIFIVFKKMSKKD
jgi:hypothetical protein